MASISHLRQLSSATNTVRMSRIGLARHVGESLECNLFTRVTSTYVKGWRLVTHKGQMLTKHNKHQKNCSSKVISLKSKHAHCWSDVITQGNIAGLKELVGGEGLNAHLEQQCCFL